MFAEENGKREGGFYRRSRTTMEEGKKRGKHRTLNKQTGNQTLLSAKRGKKNDE